MKKIGHSTYKIENTVSLRHCHALVGKKEKEGPLGKSFSDWSEDEYFGQKTFEQAEIYMQKRGINHVIQKCEILEKDIDFVFAGDLQNQCVASNYSLRGTDLRVFGLYGACSTFAEEIILSAMSIDGGFAKRTLCVTSSHYCTAERQYRFPLEYGAIRTPSAQWTVTGCGCALFDNVHDKVKVKSFTPGRIVDMGIKDMNNMGAAMAPAAADTLRNFLSDTNSKTEDFDLIVTGDLGKIGHTLFCDLIKNAGFTMDKNNVKDCGMMIFCPSTQDVHAGGSGAGCSAAVMCGHLLPEMKKGGIRRMLYIATGALMNPTLALQKESIPSVAHLVEFSSEVG